MRLSETICALSTPQGNGAIAVIRMSGPNALAISGRFIELPARDKDIREASGNTIHFGRLCWNGQLVDEVVVSVFRAPRSFTGEDVVEISCHGSVYIQQKILEIMVQAGARLAGPGEFTQRAFLNGKMDLSQAEGVADLIASGTAAAHRLAMDQMRGGFSAEISKLRNELLQFISLIELELDFSEEDVEFADREQLTSLLDRIGAAIHALTSSFEYGNVIKNGVPVAIIGRTNAGKSTLLNRLLREERAIVSEIHGTTRDVIEDVIHVGGIAFRFIDTAGLRETSDQIEHEGIQRTHQKYKQAKIVIVLIDLTERTEEVDASLTFLHEQENQERSMIFALNKSDLVDSGRLESLESHYRKQYGGMGTIFSLSARDGHHLDTLEQLLQDLAVKKPDDESGVIVTNVRHYEALSLSSQALERARDGLESGLPTDLLAQDIREILHHLGEITGEITTDEILGNIFKNFCIGK